MTFQPPVVPPIAEMLSWRTPASWGRMKFISALASVKGYLCTLGQCVDRARAGGLNGEEGGRACARTEDAVGSESVRQMP